MEAGNFSVPRTRPTSSTTAATWKSAWVSTPPVTSRGCSGMLGFNVVPFLLCQDGDDGPPAGADGQSTSRTPSRVRLLSSHACLGRRVRYDLSSAPVDGS